VNVTGEVPAWQVPQFSLQDVVQRPALLQARLRATNAAGMVADLTCASQLVVGTESLNVWSCLPGIDCFVPAFPCWPVE
jgi:hypothetical protein